MFSRLKKIFCMKEPEPMIKGLRIFFPEGKKINLNCKCYEMIFDDYNTIRTEMFNKGFNIDNTNAHYSSMDNKFETLKEVKEEINEYIKKIIPKYTRYVNDIDSDCTITIVTKNELYCRINFIEIKKEYNSYAIFSTSSAISLTRTDL